MIRMNDVGHEVAGRALFSGLSHALEKKKYGLVGPNGVGKTTLAKIITGALEPTQGQVIRAVEVYYFAQVEARGNGTLGEALSDVWESLGENADWVSRLLQGLNLETALSHLSGGEWMRVRLAKMLARSPGFLILDEPSNDLDREGRELLLTLIREYQGGILLISHDRELLGLVDVVLELSNRGLSVYGGDFEFYREMREHERERASEKLDERKRLADKAERERVEKRDRQEKRMRRGQKIADRGDMPRILVGARKRRAQVTMAKLETRERETVDTAHDAVDEQWLSLKQDPFLRLDFEGAVAPAGKTLVRAENLDLGFDGRKLWAEPLNLIVRGRERWHIRGPNGSGKSTLAKWIVRNRQANVVLAYLDQRYGLLDPEKTVLENISSRFDATELRNELAFYGFTGDRVSQKVKTLSGGELLRASLAQIFLGEKLPELIVLDEPTNNLDLGTVELLERALMAYKGALVVISHDAEFVKRLELEHELSLEK